MGCTFMLKEIDPQLLLLLQVDFHLRIHTQVSYTAFSFQPTWTSGITVKFITSFDKAIGRLMTTDLMEEDDPMVEDIDQDEEDRLTQEHSRRMSLMRGSRAADFYRSYSETLDEKGEPMAVMTPPEKLVHQNFYNRK